MEPREEDQSHPFRVTKRSTALRRLRKTTRRSRVHVQTVGLNAETKKCRLPADGEKCLLTFPAFIGLIRRASGVVHPPLSRQRFCARCKSFRLHTYENTPPQLFANEYLRKTGGWGPAPYRRFSLILGDRLVGMGLPEDYVERLGFGSFGG